MCSRVLVLAVAASLAAPVGGVAQQDPSRPSEAELREQVDSLYPLVVQARADVAAERERLLEAERRRAAAAAPVDTLRVGPLRIVTPVGQADVARALFREVWSERFGSVDRSPMLEAAWFSFQWSDERVPIYLETNPRTVQARGSVDRREVKSRIGTAVANTLAYDLTLLDTRLGRWLNGNPFDERATSDLSDAYRIVATTASKATRACLEGAVDACTSAFGLDSADDEPNGAMLDAWYTLEERRALVASRHLYGRPGPEIETRWSRCVTDGDSATCDRLLLEMTSGWGPLPGTIRSTLLALALERGGGGAWGRGLDDPALSPAAALERISGVPIDELVAEWRARVIAHRTEPHVGLASGGGLAVLWTLLFAALAMRSTRWRLG